jgi:hypothetical protein
VTDRISIIEKIKALLAKTIENGATEHEMLAALDKAAAMRDAYDVSDEELQLTKEEKVALQDFDRFFGELLAQDARDYARRSAQPDFVDLVLVWLSWVTRGEFRPLEKAFIERVFRQDPQCADRITALIYSQYPDRRH